MDKKAAILDTWKALPHIGWSINTSPYMGV